MSDGFDDQDYEDLEAVISALRARVAKLEAALLYVRAAIVKSEPDDFPIGEAMSRLDAALKDAPSEPLGPL